MNKQGSIFAYLFWVFVGVCLGVYAAFTLLKPFICK